MKKKDIDIGTTGFFILNNEQYLINQQLAQSINLPHPTDFIILYMQVVAKREEEGQMFYFVIPAMIQGLVEFLENNNGQVMLGTCRNGSTGALRDLIGWYTEYELISEFEYIEKIAL